MKRLSGDDDDEFRLSIDVVVVAEAKHLHAGHPLLAERLHLRESRLSGPPLQ